MPEPQLPHPVSPDELIRFGFDASTAEEAAQEIAELVEAVFGPMDPDAAAGWALSAERDLGPGDLRVCLAEAMEAADPLAFLASFPDARALLERRMAWRWSSQRAQSLDHPLTLRGQTWSTLSTAAQGEVREALAELVALEDARVLRHRPPRYDLDTFLSELADIYLGHAQRAGDRSARAGRPLHHRTDVPHSPTSRFIRLADLILSRVSPWRPDDPRLHRSWWTARSLSDRWKRWKAHAGTGHAESGAADGDEPAS